MDDTAGSGEPDAWAPLRLRDFRLLLVSLLAATLGTQMQATAVAYQIYSLTHDPLSLGLIGLAEALPFISLALLGGHVADASDRRRVMLVAMVGHVACSAVLVALVAARHGLSGAALKTSIYGVIACTGVARSFLQPARQALAAELVPRPLYPASVAWRTGSFQAALVAGPALGGLFYAFVGPGRTYLIAGVLMLVGLTGVSRIRPPARPVDPGPRPPLFESLRQGVAFLRSDEILLPAILLDLFAVLFGGAVALLPVFASDILHLGAREFGVLRAAPAVGAVLMSVVLALAGPIVRAGVTLLRSVAVFGLCMIGFALSRSFPLSVALLAVGGAADMISVVLRGTLMQLRTPRHMLGRLSSINQIFIGSSNEIGAFESGVAARLLGTVPSVVAGGTVTLLVVGIAAWRAPALRRLGRMK